MSHQLTDVAFVFAPNDGGPRVASTYADLLQSRGQEPDELLMMLCRSKRLAPGLRFKVTGALSRRRKVVLEDGHSHRSRPIPIDAPTEVILVGVRPDGRIRKGESVFLSLNGTGAPVQLRLDETSAKLLLIEAFLAESEERNAS